MEGDARLWELFRAVARDAAAWPALLAELEPELLAMARRQPIGRLREGEDSSREIVARVFARLHARDHAAIRKLSSLDPPPKLGAWLRVLVRRSAIDYMRESPEYERATPDRPDRWISLSTLTSGTPSPVVSSLADRRTLVLNTVRDMVERTAAEVATRGDDAFTHLALAWRIPRIHVRRLATKGAQLHTVLVGVLEGRSHGELAEQLGLTRREIELTVRALEELLQARFANG